MIAPRNESYIVRIDPREALHGDRIEQRALQLAVRMAYQMLEHPAAPHGLVGHAIAIASDRAASASLTVSCSSWSE